MIWGVPLNFRPKREASLAAQLTYCPGVISCLPPESRVKNKARPHAGRAAGIENVGAFVFIFAGSSVKLTLAGSKCQRLSMDLEESP